MFEFDSAKLGKRVAGGMNSTIFEYGEEDQGKRSHLVKKIVVVSEEKERQFTEEYMLGFNHNHPYILSYEGFSKRKTNPLRNMSEIYIKMKAMEKDLKIFIQERQDKDGHKYLPEDEIIPIFYSLAKALDYLKKKGIAHSNVVLESVLFDHKGIIKLAGFAFSKFKPWKNSVKRIYQSYYPPEKSSLKSKEQKIPGKITDEEKKKKMKEARELAFKSDVWCLGKLMVDVCLLRDQAVKDKDQKVDQILAKVKDDLAQVQDIYGDALTSILRSLLKENPQDRLSFAKICSALEQRYPGQLFKIPLNTRFDEDDDCSVSIDSYNSFAEEEETKTEERASQADPASQSGSSLSILNQGMIILGDSLESNRQALAEVMSLTRDTSQLSKDDYSRLLKFVEVSEVHSQITSFFLSHVSSSLPSLSEANSTTSAHPNVVSQLNDLNEILHNLSSQTLRSNSAQTALISLPNIAGSENSKSSTNSDPLTLFSVLKQQIKRQISKLNKAEANSAPISLPEFSLSGSEKKSAQ